MTATHPLQFLIIGGGGQVGLELQAYDWPDGATAFAPDRSTLDIADESAVADLIASRPWSAVINTAAYTAVDQAESEVGAAWRINALGPALLADATAKAKIPLVHVSTDYVFSGDAKRPYSESDPIGPLGVYGASKEGGEQAVRTTNPRHAIVRTAWVVSAHRGNFLKTMLRLGSERPVLSIVGDQVGNPTAAGDLAAALADIAHRLARDPDAPVGTYHFVNTGDTSWHGFADGIFAEARARGLATPKTKAIRTEDYPTSARRPANSRLSTEKLTRDYGIRPRPWAEAIRPILDALTGTTSKTVPATAERTVP